jgi:hypothetical protein
MNLKKRSSQKEEVKGLQADTMYYHGVNVVDLKYYLFQVPLLEKRGVKVLKSMTLIME